MTAEGKECCVQRRLERQVSASRTHVKSLGSTLGTAWTCSEAGKLAVHILLQDRPPLLSILLHSVRCSPAQNKLDGVLVTLWCEIKY